MIFFMNRYTTLAYIFAIILSSKATSTTRYQYNLLPKTRFWTPRAIKKSVNPLSSYDMALVVVDLEDR